MQTSIDAIAQAFPFGRPGAVKRGRHVQWPFVALVLDYMGQAGVTHNPMGRRAYATREEAVAASDRYIAMLRAKLRADLVRPEMRALRQQHGLPRDV